MKRGSPPRRTQYQVKTEAPTAFLKEVRLFNWQQPWSLPPTQMGPKSRQRGAAHIAGTGVTEAPTQFIRDVPRFGWRQPLSEPVRSKAKTAYLADDGLFNTPFVTPTLLDMDWLTPLSEPVRKTPAPNKVNLFPFSAKAPPVAEPRGLDWFQPFSVPVRPVAQAARLADDGLFSVPFTPPAVVALDWLQPFSDPVRRVVQTARLADDGLFNAPLTVSMEWFNGLSLPTRAKQRAIADYAYAPLAVSEVVTVDKWFNPLAPPQNAKRGLNAALQQAYATEYFPDTVNANAGQWFIQLAEPVRIRRVTPSDQSFVPVVTTEVITVDKWFVSFAEPVRQLPTRPKVGKSPFTAIAATAEIVTVDKWFVSLSEPVRFRSQLATALQQSLAFVKAAPFPSVTESRFDQAWSEPLRSKPGLSAANQSAFFAPSTVITPEVITVDKWLSPWTTPARKPSLATAQQQAFTASAFPYVPFSWFKDLSEPTRLRRVIAPDQPFVATVTTEVVTVDKWFTPFSEPARIKRSLIPDQSLVPFVSTEVVTVDKWFKSFAEPVRTVPSRFSGLQQSYTSGYVSFETVTVDKWFDPLSEPVRTIPALRTALQPVSTQDTVFIPNPSRYLEGWFNPLSEPVRQLPGLKASQQSFFAISWVLETVTVDKWFAAFSEPVRTKPGLRMALQPVSTQDTVFIPNPSRYLEGWFNPLSEPVQKKAAAQQNLTVGPLTTTEVVTVDKWLKPLSDPTKRKPGDYDRYNGENDFVAIAASMEWFAPLTEPVRQKIGLAVGQQQSSTFVAVFGEVVTIDKWFASFSEPVRVKASLLTARQQSLTWPTQIIIPSLASWWRPLSDPPKAKAGLATAQQRFEARTADFIPHPNQYLEGWYNWWSEPVRTKPGLSARLQSSWVAPARVIQTTVTLSMSATETGVDVATIAITVLPYNPPASAVVSLKEIGTGASLTSIVEIGDDGSLTSVVES